MERDFTAQSYDNFCTLIDQINDEQWCGISDWFGDCFFGLKHLLQDWGILERTTEINTYYKELLDRKDTSKTAITQVFESISNLDTFFAGIRYFGYCKNYLDAFRQVLTGLSTLAFKADANNLSNIFHPVAIQSWMGSLCRQLQNFSFSDLEIDSLPKAEYQFTPSTFAEISQADKEAFVSRCERLCPNLAEAVNGLFTDPDWTEQEQLDTKFILYNASDPYRSIFLKNALCCNTVVFQIGSKDSNGYDNSCCRGKSVYLEDGDDNMINNPRAPYNTVFHEYGHAVDNAVYNKGVALSSFWGIGENNLQYYITEDVQRYVNQKIDSMCSDQYTSLNAEQKQLLLNEENRKILLASLNLAGESKPYGGSTDELPEELKIHYNLLQSAMSFDLSGEINCAASDVYGGVTNNAIGGTYGHKGDNYEFYWYKENGLPTNQQAAELWAEFFAAQMTHDEESLASIKKHFPTTYPVLEEMALQLDPIPTTPS